MMSAKELPHRTFAEREPSGAREQRGSMLLPGARVLVTGGSSGIGLAICKVLTRNGARVWATGRNAEALDRLGSEGHIEGYSIVDLTDRELVSRERSSAGVSAIEALVDDCAKAMGGLTAVVNAAGVLKAGAMGDVGVDNYDYNMDTNTRAPFEIMTYATPHLKKAAAEAKANAARGPVISPCIVNISSVNGKQSFPGCVSYCMSKAAVDMMTRCASVDLAKYGVRVNAVNPGMVVTNLQKRGGLTDDQYGSFLKRQIEVTHPLGEFLERCGEPEEVGELVAFLLSDKAQFVTGECIAMDGGRQNLGSR